MNMPLNSLLKNPSQQDQCRYNMVEQQIRPWNVLDKTVLNLLATLPRENFVPASQQHLAFVDIECPLPAGQNMLAPKVEARMVQDLKLQKTDTVLQIGTGSGYTAALSAALAKKVLSLEIEPAIASAARSNLQNAAIANVEVRTADGTSGAAADGPFDAILLSGSVAAVPQVLLDQLKIGGRLIAIVGNLPIMRVHLITRSSATEFSTQQPWDTVATRLVNFPEATHFSF